MKGNKPITVTIPSHELDDISSDWGRNAEICKRLAAAGVPIVGGPLMAKVDQVNGTLEWSSAAAGLVEVFRYIPKGAK